MRNLALLVVAVVLVAGCGTSNSSPASGPTPGPAPTATLSPNAGKLLLQAKGNAVHTTTAAFTANGNWRATYEFSCLGTDPVAQKAIFEIDAINMKHPNGQEQIMTYATAISQITRGSSDVGPAGRFKLYISTDPVCAWRVVVKTV